MGLGRDDCERRQQNRDSPCLGGTSCSTGEKRAYNNEGSVLCIFIGDLAPDVTNTLLYETVAGRYPSVKGAKVVVDTNTGCSNGYGFVGFADNIDRTRAMNEMMVSIVQAGLCISVFQLLRSHLLNNSMNIINFLLKFLTRTLIVLWSEWWTGSGKRVCNSVVLLLIYSLEIRKLYMRYQDVLKHKYCLGPLEIKTVHAKLFLLLQVYFVPTRVAMVFAQCCTKSVALSVLFDTNECISVAWFTSDSTKGGVSIGRRPDRTGPAKTGPDRRPNWSKTSDRGPDRNTFGRSCTSERAEVYYECREPFKSLKCLWVRSKSIAATWLEKVVTPLIEPAIQGFAAASTVLKPERLKVDKHGMSEPMSYYLID
nr:polyadenylate-binding protein RBP47-like [Tanacetum cinerariifolium]